MNDHPTAELIDGLVEALSAAGFHLELFAVSDPPQVFDQQMAVDEERPASLVTAKAM